MARNITIRRVGGLLPALSLVVFVLLASVITWLSTAGLPRVVLERLEEGAARAGYHLHLDCLKLSPASGLALRARGVTLYAKAQDTQPLATLERATVALSFSSLLRGELRPSMAEFRGLNISLPTDGDAPLKLTNVTASANIRQGNIVQLTSASAQLEDVSVKVHGAFKLPDMEKKPSPEPQADDAPTPSLTKLLAEWKDEAGFIQRNIAAQRWTADAPPVIDLTLLDVANSRRLSAFIFIPRYDEGQFHFRDVYLDVLCQQHTIVINRASFKTIEPESSVTLQGGYDIAARFLKVNLQSTAALTRMAEAITIPGVDMANINTWLARFHHPDDAPPEISLQAELAFEENFSPTSIMVQGQIIQRDFTYGQTKVDELVLPFFYRNGSFNIDSLKLTFPTGSLTLKASASSGTQKGKASLTADLDVPHLLQLASEFTPTPLSLPDDVELTGNLKLQADAELDIPSFVAGSTRLGQFLPTLHFIDLKLSIDKASHKGTCIEKPQISLILNHLQKTEESLTPHGLEHALLDFKAEAIQLPAREGEAEGSRFRQVALGLNLTDARYMAEDEDSTPSLHIGSANASLQLASLSLQGLDSESVSLELRDVKNLCPLAEDWRQMLQQGAFIFRVASMRTGDTLLGTADGKLILADDGHIDFSALLEREGHSVTLNLHPQLTPDGLLVLNGVQLELPVAGFAPLLSLAGVDISQIRLPDALQLEGNASYDTRANYLRQAEGTLTIPHLVRTPGDGVAAFRGKEIPLAVRITGKATGQLDGHVELKGTLDVTHKTTQPSQGDERTIHLSFWGNTASDLHLKGTNTMDVGVVDQLLDLRSAHVIMRDFDTHEGSRTDVDIDSVDIDWADGLTVTAVCHARIRDIGYQMNAFVDEKDAEGKRTGKEALRKDFGKDPFRKVEKATARVDVLYRENALGKVEATRISILNADITYNNRPWLRQRGIRGGSNRSRLQGDAIIIDVEDGFVELKNVRGKAYPAYAIGAYYDDLPGFMESITFIQPASVETQHCLFPIYKNCKRSMTGNIRVEANRANFRFLGTTFPLSSFSGFVWFKEGAVGLDRLNAACWDGAINSAFIIDYTGKHTGFDGYATLSNINLKPLAAAYGSKQESALCHGTIRFRTPSPNLDDLQAYGEVHVVDGDLMSLGLFRPVGDLISDLPGNLAALENKAQSSKDDSPGWIKRQVSGAFQTTGKAVTSVGKPVGWMTDHIPFANHFLRYDLQEVHSRFSIRKGKLITEGMKALGYNLNVGVQLDINLDDVTLEGDLWPKISSVPTILLSPITFLSDFMIDIHVFGPFDNIEWTLGLNRKNKEAKGDCSVSDKKPQHNLQPRKRKKP